MLNDLKYMSFVKWGVNEPPVGLFTPVSSFHLEVLSNHTQINKALQGRKLLAQ
jgi:hypothetical protein